MNFLYALLFLSFSLLIYVFHKNRKVRRLPPGPWQLPIVGYLPWINGRKPHETLTKLVRVYGPVCGFRMGSVYTVLLSDPQLIRQTFAKDAFAGRAPLYLTHGIMQGYGKISFYIYPIIIAGTYLRFSHYLISAPFLTLFFLIVFSAYKNTRIQKYKNTMLLFISI